MSNINNSNNNNNNNQEFIYRDTTNVEDEVNNHTGNNWSHSSSNKRFKEKFGIHIRKTFSSLTTKASNTWNITRNMESAAV
jgi:hypothetical protein